MSAPQADPCASGVRLLALLIAPAYWLVRVQTCCLEPCHCPSVDAKAFAALILSSYTPDLAHRVALLTDSLQLP